MRVILIIGISILLFFVSYRPVLAQSTYVLPYPSSMPGNKFYSIHLVWEKVSKYWYIGNLSQFVYNLQLADKYLVEAKTLFEYKQYLYAHMALLKSDFYFENTYPFLTYAQKYGVNTTEKEALFREAGQKHSEILLKIKQEVPKEFVWTPEKEVPMTLFLWEVIDRSLDKRVNFK